MKKSNPETILVVDDDPAILLLIKAILEGRAYRVLLAENGESAIHLIEQEQLRIDLVLTDVMMPNMSGLDLANTLVAMRPGLRVLFMSAFQDSDAVRMQVLERGSGFVAKPFKTEGLVAAVERALKHLPAEQPKVLSMH
jgi:DNA-binding NtrC family response regulator